MSKLEDRENRRRSTVGKIVGQTPVAAVGSGRRGRPKEDRELKKRISLSVLPSVYEGIQKDTVISWRSLGSCRERKTDILNLRGKSGADVKQ